MKKYIIIVLFHSIFFPQKLINEYIDQVMSGNISVAIENLPEYISKYPNHPGVLYLSALLETDGSLAKEKFAQIYNNHKSSEYSDKSVMKVSEYYYTAGLYNQSAKWLKKIPQYYSKSNYLDKSIKLFINSLTVAGDIDSVEYYIKVFKKQFPDINLTEVILEVKNDYAGNLEPELVELSKSNISKKEETVIAKESPENKNIMIKIQDLLNRVKEDITSPINEYTLQAGAFGKKSNAEYQKKILLDGGYDARIENVNSNGIILYIVRVGYFENRSDAKQYQDNIYSRLAVNSIIIKNE